MISLSWSIYRWTVSSPWQLDLHCNKRDWLFLLFDTDGYMYICVRKEIFT